MLTLHLDKVFTNQIYDLNQLAQYIVELLRSVRSARRKGKASSEFEISGTSLSSKNSEKKAEIKTIKDNSSRP